MNTLQRSLLRAAWRGAHLSTCGNPRRSRAIKRMVKTGLLKPTDNGKFVIGPVGESICETWEQNPHLFPELGRPNQKPVNQH